MNFDFSGAIKAKDSAPALTAGIKDATFKGISFDTSVSQKTGDTYKVMVFKIDVDGYGEYTQNFFEPTSNERSDNQWGGKSPSQVDHFMIIVREILEAIDPQLIEDLDTGTKKLGGTFKQIVDAVAKFTDPYIDKAKFQVKFIPQSNGYNSIPSYPARITKNGDLGIATRIVGQNLVLTTSEENKVNAAAKAKPTNMAAKSNVADTLSAITDDLDSDDNDLPF